MNILVLQIVNVWVLSLNKRKEAPVTNRQFTSDKEYGGTVLNSFYKNHHHTTHKNT